MEAPPKSTIVSQGETSTDDDQNMFNSDNEDTMEPPKDDQQPPFYDAQADQLQTSHSAPNTDAILSCPACLQIVCVDCQRHCQYTDQYRAMFVQNVDVQWKTRLQLSQQQGLVDAVDDTDIYHPVVCANCETRVAALEMKEEVYHFYGCLASS